MDFEAEIAKYTYKPGWTLECLPTKDSRHELSNTDWFLRITLNVPESSDASQNISTSCDFVLGAGIEDVATLDTYVRSALLWAEAHECDEWLRRDGRQIFTPAHHGAGNSIFRALTKKYLRVEGNPDVPVDAVPVFVS